MSARDELADLILSEFHAGATATSSWRLNPSSAADKILAAGYRKPRTITTAEDLDALPIGAIVANLDTGHVALKSWQSKHPRKDGTPLSEWLVTGDNTEQGTCDLALPATVLYTPKES